MKRAKKTVVEPQEKRITPDEETLRYGYGLMANLKTKSA